MYTILRNSNKQYNGDDENARAGACHTAYNSLDKRESSTGKVPSALYKVPLRTKGDAKAADFVHLRAFFLPPPFTAVHGAILQCTRTQFRFIEMKVWGCMNVLFQSTRGTYSKSITPQRRLSCTPA